MSSVLALHLRGDRPGGSLPKLPTVVLTVTVNGCLGDKNRYRDRRRKGDPAMAVLVLPDHVFADLASEGWPVQPGDLGENVTLAGVSHDLLVAGARLVVAADHTRSSVELELSEPCHPCRTLAQLPYVGATGLAAFQRALRGRRGFYARVLREGTLQVGDQVRMTPP